VVDLMVGFLIGAVAGAVQFLALVRFARLITRSDTMMTAVLFGMLQFLIPLAALVGVAFLSKSYLLPAACGIVAVLVIGAFIKYVVFSRKGKGREEKDA